MEDKQLLERGHVRQLEVEQHLEGGNWIRDGHKIACKRKITVRLCELGDLLNLSCFLLKLSPHKGLAITTISIFIQIKSVILSLNKGHDKISSQ